MKEQIAEVLASTYDQWLCDDRPISGFWPVAAEALERHYSVGEHAELRERIAEIVRETAIGHAYMESGGTSGLTSWEVAIADAVLRVVGPALTDSARMFEAVQQALEEAETEAERWRRRAERLLSWAELERDLWSHEDSDRYAQMCRVVNRIKEERDV